MSVCISSKGEFGSHNLDNEYVCADCGVIDEASRGAELLALRARVAELEAAQREPIGWAVIDGRYRAPALLGPYESRDELICKWGDDASKSSGLVLVELREVTES